MLGYDLGCPFVTIPIMPGTLMPWRSGTIIFGMQWLDLDLIVM